MSKILVINPEKKKRPKKRSAKKEVKTMAKAKRRRTTKTRTYKRRAAPKRRVRRRNPSRRRRVARAAASRVRSTIAGMNIRSAFRDLPPTMVGMFAAKWAAKRFGSAATETDPATWTWASYLKGAVGAFVAGFLAQNIRRGWGQKVLNGGMSLMAYKVIENELVPRSPWAMAQFGEGDYYPSEYIQTDEQGTPYMLGQNGQWMPVDERHRLPESSLSDVLETPGRLGDVLEPPGRLGEITESYRKAFFGVGNPYAQAYFG